MKVSEQILNEEGLEFLFLKVKAEDAEIECETSRLFFTFHIY
jgi:hypothetical protein